MKQNPVIAYEAAKFAPVGNGESSVPTTSIFPRYTKHFHVVLVDEHNTSQVCHRCDQITCPVMNDRLLNKELRWCRSTNCRTFLNRDRNAALNIARCLRGGTPRPKRLVRIPYKKAGRAPRPPAVLLTLARKGSATRITAANDGSIVVHRVLS